MVGEVASPTHADSPRSANHLAHAGLPRVRQASAGPGVMSPRSGSIDLAD